MCVSPGIPLDMSRIARLTALAVPAATEAMWDAFADAGPAEPIPAILVLPPDSRPDHSSAAGGALIAALTERAGLPIDPARSSIVHADRAGASTALMRAMSMGTGPVLVGAVDSFCEPAALRWLDERFMLHGLDVEDGFIPSEGAGFCVIGPQRRDALARITFVAEQEEATDVNLGAAMSSLFARAGTLPWVLSDQNGESWRAIEWGFVATRQALHAHLDRPLLELGDVGAAAGMLLTNLACERWRRRFAPSRRVGVALANDDARRGLIVLEQIAEAA